MPNFISYDGILKNMRDPKLLSWALATSSTVVDYYTQVKIHLILKENGVLK
jgi:hypothetical protein